MSGHAEGSRINLKQLNVCDQRVSSQLLRPEGYLMRIKNLLSLLAPTVRMGIALLFVSGLTAPASLAQSGGVAINSGGPAVSPFVADVDFTGGSTINHANTIDLRGVTNPAPMAVYQTARVVVT